MLQDLLRNKQLHAILQLILVKLLQPSSFFIAFLQALTSPGIYMSNITLKSLKSLRILLM